MCKGVKYETGLYYCERKLTSIGDLLLLWNNEQFYLNYAKRYKEGSKGTTNETIGSLYRNILYKYSISFMEKIEIPSLVTLENKPVLSEKPIVKINFQGVKPITEEEQIELLN
jgi:hypothetical protein